MSKIQVFGDSHCAYFQPTPKLFSHAPALRQMKIEVTRIHGASIIGLGKLRSALQVNERVNSLLDPTAHAVFAFGQVDLELGYYYRCAVNNEDISIESFVYRLVDEYEKYLIGLPLPAQKLIVKGHNLTVLRSRKFALDYILPIISKGINNQEETKAVEQRLGECLESFFSQTAAAIRFNKLIAAVCAKHGWGYFDVNHQISNGNPERGVADIFVPIGRDHHLSDSVETRKIHIAALLEIVRARAG